MVLAFSFASTRRPWDTYLARRMKCNFQAVGHQDEKLRDNFVSYPMVIHFFIFFHTIYGRAIA